MNRAIPNNTSITCTRRLEFCAAHRLMGHMGLCGFLHGHNYVVDVTAAPAGFRLDNLGMVVDFSIVKIVLGSWLAVNWDHATILNGDDTDAVATLQSLKSSDGRDPKLYMMPHLNPTAENMAEYLLNNICPKLFADQDFVITNINVWETNNGYAMAWLREE